MDLLCEDVKRPVLYSKQMKGYREKDVVSNAGKKVGFIENAKSNLSCYTSDN